MSTIFKNILPIPYDTIVGTGSYVIPANKYAFFQANVSHSTCGWFGASANYNSVNTQSISQMGSTSGGGVSNNGFQWLVAGDSITTSSSAVTQQSGSALQCQASYADGYSYVNLNGNVFISARSTGFAGMATGGASLHAGVRQNANASWSVALYDIPINNLPSELIVS